MKAAITEYYGTNPKDSPNYGRIVNNRHFKRVQSLMDKGKVLLSLMGSHISQPDSLILISRTLFHVCLVGLILEHSFLNADRCGRRS